MALPQLDPDQRRAASEKAVAARRARAALKADLKAGRTGLAEVLERAASTEAVAKMRVSEVLEAMPAYGPRRARRLMEDLDIAPSRRVRGLGPRQREALLATFGDPRRDRR